VAHTTQYGTEMRHTGISQRFLHVSQTWRDATPQNSITSLLQQQDLPSSLCSMNTALQNCSD